jgi:hypothetical protein
MEENLDIPEESMRHIEALLARHPPHLIQRMFSQALDSRMFVDVPIYASALTEFRPQFHSLVLHVDQHCQLDYNIFLRFIMAISTVNSVDIFIVNR